MAIRVDMPREFASMIDCALRIAEKQSRFGDGRASRQSEDYRLVREWLKAHQIDLDP